jgi:Flp pilus assembly protein TadG
MSPHKFSPTQHRLNGYLRRASVTVQFAMFGSLVGVGVAALAVDTGLMFAARQELQNAADSAALAAASQLGTAGDATAAAVQEAAQFAAYNKVDGDGSDLLDADVVLGHATLVNDKYEFQPNTLPHDAVQVTIRRDATAADGPVSLLFAKSFGAQSTDLTASAIAMLVPRDIAVVIDLSGSMNDDSELRHYKQFDSEIAGEPDRAGVQINLRDIWCALNGPAPAQPYVPGLPSQTEYSADTGPTWGEMNTWGDDVILGSYNPTTDPGLLYLKKTVTCTATSVSSQLLTRGYKNTSSSSPSTMKELDCIMKGTKDNEYSNNFKNRTKVILGLAEWRSGKSNSKYGHNVGGDGDDKVEDSELTAALSYPSGMSGGSWDDYLTYVSGTSEMTSTDSNLRYRYGLKTFVNYLMEKRSKNSHTPQLAGAPEMPLRSVKDAVQSLIDTIVELDTQDHCSLEIFATTGQHEIDLTTPDSGESLADALQEIPDTLYLRQAGHYDSTTCIGCGLDEGLSELSSVRARAAAAKVMILMTDGKPNIAPGGASPDQYCIDQANAAKELGVTLYTVGVGADVAQELLQEVADIGNGEYFFADSAPDPSTGLPLYVTQLQEIFETLGGKRPVRLIN